MIMVTIDFTNVFESRCVMRFLEKYVGFVYCEPFQALCPDNHGVLA